MAAVDAPREPYDPVLIERGRKLFLGPVDFLLGAPSLAVLPPPDLPEIAFAGRSNVGKSSLVNALTGRNALARTSNTPGRTQELNFFALGDAMRLVDMPGYGYAQAPEAKVKAWTRLVFSYLRGRPNLKRVYVLVDARHGMKPVDGEVLDLLDKAAVSYQIVLTKADKIGKDALPGLIEATSEAIRRRPAAFPRIAATSSAKGWGIEELRAEIAEAGRG